MAWLAVDKNGTERIYPFEPYRVVDCWTCSMYMALSNPITLPKGSIKKLIGTEITWEDEAVEFKGED